MANTNKVTKEKLEGYIDKYLYLFEAAQKKINESSNEDFYKVRSDAYSELVHIFRGYINEYKNIER